MLFPFLATLLLGVVAHSVPHELFSPLIQQKISGIAQTRSPNAFPQYTDTTVGSWLYFSPDTWTTGFFPATMYALAERERRCPSFRTADSTDWLTLGRGWSTAEIPLEATTSVGHDVGFLSYPFMHELTINALNQTAIQAINMFAAHLASRFNPIVGCTRSWDTVDPTDFTVIIDNMMNLEVLFASATLTGNQTLRDIAISHANKTMVNHVRPDGSTFHVVEYNATTGAVIRQRTAQGYADNSTWSRGQAWAIHGFAMMYQNTLDSRYLDMARRLASYFLANLPPNGVTPWDFNAPTDPPPPADSSAAAIASDGMLLLSQLETSLSPSNTSGADFWNTAAIRILRSTTNLAWQPSWQSLLSNGTVNKPMNNYLTGIVYGDYFYVTAGNRMINMGLADCPNAMKARSNSVPRNALRHFLSNIHN